MPRTPHLPLLIAAALSLAGCTTNSVTPKVATTPPPPAPVIELPPASITGFEETSTMLDNFTVFVGAIDGIPVAAGRAGWNAPLTLKAGLRRLTLEFNRGVFSAKTEVQLNATSEIAYQVRFATDAQLFGKNSYCDFWIVDTAGNEVTPRVRTNLVKSETAAK